MGRLFIYSMCFVAAGTSWLEIGVENGGGNLAGKRQSQYVFKYVETSGDRVII